MKDGDDEAKVRDEIADRWITHPDPPMGGLIGRVYGAVREAYAAGKSDEREACVILLRASGQIRRAQADRIKERRGENQDYSAVADLAEELKSAADAIARRGSEGT